MIQENKRREISPLLESLPFTEMEAFIRGYKYEKTGASVAKSVGKRLLTW